MGRVCVCVCVCVCVRVCVDASCLYILHPEVFSSVFLRLQSFISAESLMMDLLCRAP